MRASTTSPRGSEAVAADGVAVDAAAVDTAVTVGEGGTRPGTAWRTATLVAFDTETTGVDVTNDRVVTAALVRRQLGAGRDGQSSTSWLIDPGVEIPAGATAVHGISTAHARAHGRPPAAALEEIAESLASAARSGACLVAFNATYDFTILDRELARYGRPGLASRLGGHGHALVVLDPLVLDRAFDRFRKGKRTLAHLCDVYQITVTEDLHSADADAGVTLDVLDRLAQRYPQLVEMSRDELMSFQRAEHERWATSFNQWRDREGLTGPPVSTTWL